ncbi:MAG TPA: hypothetical protein VGH28_18910 [Polyangiaceae bacterium]
MDRICFTSTEDDLLARGWPRCAELVDGHPDGRRPASSAAAYFASKRWYGAEIPREVAVQILRSGRSEPSSKPVAKAEAKAILAGALDSRRLPLTEARQVADLVFIVEHIAGTNDTLETITAAFEAVETRRVPSPALVAAPATLAFLLMRAPPSARTAFRSRLEAQRERVARAGWDVCTRNFDLSLNGTPIVKQLVWRRRDPDLELLDYAVDDPEFVRLLVARHPLAKISVRAVAIGGLATMSSLAPRCLRAFPARAFPALLRDFGMVKSPETVDLALALVGRTHVKDAPLRWLVAHATYARPLVEASAKSGSPIAKTVLRKLAGKW